MAKMTMVQALNLALRQEMQKDDSIIVLGEDVGVDGGVFRVTDGLTNQFGDQRVLDTPLAESGIVGMSIGMAAYGLKPVCEIQFSGFAYQNFLSKLSSNRKPCRPPSLAISGPVSCPYGYAHTLWWRC
jgi:pyruvate dehydrogenase E1 component beta subunit